MLVPWWAWLAVAAVILALLAVDLFAHRKAHVIGVREAAVWSASLGRGRRHVRRRRLADAGW